MGSHVKYAMQYPEKERFFDTSDEMIDTYNDSIRYSDKVIQQAVDIAMKLKYPGFVLYVSDHGENLNDYKDGNFGHGTRDFTRFEFEIPVSGAQIALGRSKSIWQEILVIQFNMDKKIK